MSERYQQALMSGARGALFDRFVQLRDASRAHSPSHSVRRSRLAETGALLLQQQVLSTNQLADTFHLRFHDVQSILPALTAVGLAEVSQEGLGKGGRQVRAYRPNGDLEETMAWYHRWRLEVAQEAFPAQRNTIALDALRTFVAARIHTDEYLWASRRSLVMRTYSADGVRELMTGFGIHPGFADYRGLDGYAAAQNAGLHGFDELLAQDFAKHTGEQRSW